MNGYGLKSIDSTFVKGHQLYYNFIRPHEGLNGYTPAHFSNIYLDLNENKWENLLIQSVKNKNRISMVFGDIFNFSGCITLWCI